MALEIPKRNIVVVGGTGNIGSATVDRIAGQTNHRLAGIVNSSAGLFDPKKLKTLEGQIRAERAENVRNVRALIRKTMESSAEVGITRNELVQALKDLKMENVTILDITDFGKYDFHADVLQNSSYQLVTAAKQQLSESSFGEYQALMGYEQEYDIEATVLAGKGIFDSLKKLKYRDGHPGYSQDEILEMTLVASGSIGGSLECLMAGKPADQAFRENERSFEPKPFLDLSGSDLAGKMITVLRYLGFDISKKSPNVRIKPLVSQKYAGMEKDVFFDAIAKENDIFSQLVKEAIDAGENLVYVANCKFIDGEPNVTVQLERRKQATTLGGATGKKNVFEIYTKGMEQSGDPADAIVGAGAGQYATARGLMDGVDRIASRRNR